MALSRMKSLIRRNQTLYRFGAWAKGNLPKRFYYSKDYFRILELNKRYERPDQRLAVETELKRQLAAYLKAALQHVPYYSETVKVRPGDIDESNAVSALMEFPYLHKAIVMDNKEAFLNRTFDRSSLTYFTSGGSTGRGIGVWRSKDEIQIESAFVLSEWGKFGLDWERSRIVKIGADANKQDHEDPFKYHANRLYVSTFHLNDTWMDEIYRAIIAFRPHFIWSYPSCVEALAGHMMERERPRMRLKGLLLSSESFQLHQYTSFKRAFDAPISDLYGLTERTNMAFLRESESGEDFYYRLVDTYGYSENYRDEHGNDEIVGTSYWNFAMPLIRYRTQDLGSIDENGIIRRLQGRAQDFIIDKKGRRIPALSVNIQKYTWDYVNIYQLVQDKAGDLIVRFVPKPNFTEAIKESILDYLRRDYEEFFDVHLEVVKDIARTESGKRRFMISNLAQR
jgi:phenylacetate-CoA ligase